MSSTTITISRTHQVEQYSPLTITVTDTYDKRLDKDEKEKQITRLHVLVDEVIRTEVKRARKNKSK